MSQQLPVIIHGLTYADLTEAEPDSQFGTFIKRVKDSLQAVSNVDVRPVGLQIHIRLRDSRNEYMPLLLPNGSYDFATELDRNKVMDRIGWANPDSK